VHYIFNIRKENASFINFMNAYWGPSEEAGSSIISCCGCSFYFQLASPELLFRINPLPNNKKTTLNNKRNSILELF